MKRFAIAAVLAAMISAAAPSTTANAGTVCCAAGTKGTSQRSTRVFPYGTAGTKGNAGLPVPFFWLP